MPLSGVQSEPDPFSPDNDRIAHYPELDGVPTLLGFEIGKFSPGGRQAFINAQLALARQEFKFTPSPIEAEALSYYYGRFFNREADGASKGLLLGTALGALWVWRTKNPSKLTQNTVGRILKNPRYQLAFTMGLKFWFTTGMCWNMGMVLQGVSAFNEMQRDMKADQNVQRYIYMRRQFFEERKRRVEAGQPVKPIMGYVQDAARQGQQMQNQYTPGYTGQREQQEDDQSLGGLDFYPDDKPTVDTTANSTARTPEQWAQQRIQQQQQTRPQYPAQQPRVDNTDDDPFAFGAPSNDPDSPQYQAPVAGAPSSAPSRPGSAWDRLRRGERPASTPGPGSSMSAPPAPPRANEDTFAFSADNDRKAAREAAQAEFNRRLEKERNGEGLDGFVRDGRNK